VISCFICGDEVEKGVVAKFSNVVVK